MASPRTAPASPLDSAPASDVLNGPSHAPAGVDADPSLLDLVPAAEAGATLTYDPETTASVAADPSLARDVNDLAIGLARPLNAAPDDANFAIVNVVRIRDPGSVDDSWFRAWRDSYDLAACAQAGGVARHAQTIVNGRDVFSAGCTNGAFTYHVLIGDAGFVLSVTSVGPNDLGRTIVERLHP